MENLSVVRKNGGIVAENITGSLINGYKIFCFSPMDYFNNLEEVLEHKEIHLIEVGYKTTVKEALKRLRQYEERLAKIKHKPLPYKNKLIFDEIYKGIKGLKGALTYSRYNEEDIFLYNQNPYQKHLIKFNEEDEILGLEDNWYDNEAANNEKLIQLFENTELSIEEMIEETSTHLPQDEISNFFSELMPFMGYQESTYGPNPVSELFVFKNEFIKSDTPSVLYKNVMNVLIKIKQEGSAFLNDIGIEFEYEISDEDVVACSKILMKDINEFFIFLEKLEKTE